MPKNAVRRLQKIENDIKTVISIYDVTSKSVKEDAQFETEKEPPEEVHSTQGQVPFFDSLKKIGSFVKRPPQDVTKKHGMFKKPGSAPSSSSALSKICESHSMWQASSQSDSNSKLKWERGVLSKTRTSDDLSASKWINSSSSSAVYEVFMTPSKTLETANEVLANSNFKTNKDLEDPYSSKKQPLERQECEKFGFSETNSSSGFEKLKSKRTESGMRNLPQPSVHLSSRSFAVPKSRLEPKKDKSTSEISPTRHIIPKKIQRVEKPKPGILDLKTAPQRRFESKEVPENKNWTCINNMEGNMKTRQQSDGGYRDDSQCQKGRREEDLDGERKSDEDEYQKDHRVNNVSDSSSNLTSQKMPDSELGAHELFKIIEKSNEKLEKMKISKELALDIANKLKDKCDEIQQSKEEMMERLQKVEKDNERLNNEVRNAYESKKKLQVKMEGFRNNSKTLLLEQDAKMKEMMDENAWLKARLGDLEKRHKEDILEKEREIDRIQRERFIENRNEFKARDDHMEDLQRLTNEKSELLAKIDELRSFLQSRRSKEETLEEKICQLQEEVQRQKQHLKRKTERLEETNRELELIRQNSTDLEEQVKILRGNIENFDKLHQNLINQTVDYEHQIKSHQEEIKKLQEENEKLKAGLETERDSLLIKNKIIEDQQETIKQLREKSEEVKTLAKKNQSLERILNIEREEKLELQEAVEALKWRKDELKKKIKNLENDLLLAPQEVVRDLQKTQIVLHELENQVQIKQKEWELHLQALIKEKEQACSVAEFATKKLMQTTNEFQKQSEAQKRLHRALAENLAEKEKHLRRLEEKMSQQIMSDMRPDGKIRTCSMGSYLCSSDTEEVVTEMLEWYPGNLPPECQPKEALLLSRYNY